MFFIEIKKSYLRIAVMAFVISIFLGISVAYAKKKVTRCHRCKDKEDLSLVYRHKQLGFEGCFTCHKDQLDVDKKEKINKFKWKH